jgi:glucokinase
MDAHREIVAVDIGGTHARFALAAVQGRRVVRLDPPVILRTGEHEGLESAWAAFAEAIGRAPPPAAAVALAAPVGGEALTLTNNDWTIRPAEAATRLGLERWLYVNDFGAVAHAVGQLGSDHFRPLCGPDRPLPKEGVVSVIGPGTGLGAAMLVRSGGEDAIIETEAGHVGFAPVDPFEAALAAEIGATLPRVSAERVVSGPGLAAIYRSLARAQGVEAPHPEEKALWEAALGGRDPLASAALERFCRALGSLAGDLALAQGASAVVVAGGLGLRLAGHLPGSGFAARFAAKGRFEARMSRIPVKLLVHPQPGLLGAAAAFAVAQASKATPPGASG